ncbi:hypothetical protein AVEN_99477-1 [Araneus ventricosus]|uniref:Secreted protein n=1 Tax=Araneus ventricosus TaxID=182803 RepID=A0A4Y2FZT9_ARAVE|nr:hypothetical protein AVEN_99477-1 [Araneus ventricosus]
MAFLIALFSTLSFANIWVSGDLVVRTRLRGRGYHVRDPIPSKNRRVNGPSARHIRRSQMSSHWRGAEARSGCWLLRHPRHLNTVQIYKVRQRSPQVPSKLDINKL